MNLNFKLGSKFPNVNFKAKDIEDLVKVELSLNHEVRMKYSFYVLYFSFKNIKVIIVKKQNYVKIIA